MTSEKNITASKGWVMLAVTALMFVAIALYLVLFIHTAVFYDGLGQDLPVTWVAGFVVDIVLFIGTCILCNGFFSLQPGQARVCVLFGTYVGTVRDEGFYWANPFYAKSLGNPQIELETEEKSTIKSRLNHTHTSVISTRIRTLNGERLKVNDKMGNPIEIATVVIWHVEDTAKALFEVDDYESFVGMQAETALRHVASIYAYDHMEDDDATATSITLRSNIEEVSASLKQELGVRLQSAGIAVDDARLTHLAYAPEIAQAMLRRQQAEAVIAARKKIVEGAVGMVDMALTQLSDGGVVDFDDDRKAVMASNLMVVLCGESDAQPVLNTGSLYQ